MPDKWDQFVSNDDKWKAFEAPATSEGNNPQPSVGQSVYQPAGGAQKPDFLAPLLSALGPVGGAIQQVREGNTRPLVAGTAAGIVGGFTPAISAVTAPATYTAVDALLQKLGDPKKPIDQVIKSAATDAVFNELGGALFKGGAKVIKNLKQPLAPAGSIYNLNPTTSQLFEQVTGQKAPVSKMVEDVFNGFNKAAAKEQSARLADVESDKIAQGMARSPYSNDPNYQADLFQHHVKHQLDASYKEADRQAQTAYLMAKGNVVNTPNGPVEGPVNIFTTLVEANKYVKNRMQINATLGIHGVPTDDPLFDLANQLIANTGAQFDPNGALFNSSPISFAEAWQFKRLADQHGYGKSAMMNKAAVHTPSNSTVQLGKTFSDSLNADIDASLGAWTNDPQGVAKKAWNYAKATVAERQTLFNVTGDKLKNIINRSQAPLPSVNKIIDDPKQLQRALNVGDITFPSGVISSTNMKADLQAYQFKRIWESAIERNPKNANVIRVNADKLTEQLNDPKMGQSLGILYNKQQLADIGQFFSNVAHTQEKMSTASMSKKIWLAKTGVVVGGGLLTNQYVGPVFGTGAAVGIYLGGAAMGRLLTNPKTARILVDIAAGKPAGMSTQAVSRIFAGALKGYQVGIVDSSGQTHDSEVDETGQIRPVQ